MRIAVGSDHAAFDMKDPIVAFIRSLGHEVIDLGTNSDDRVDYPDYADLVARRVAAGEADRGVLLCGTGIGMALTADKVPGIRAAAIQTPEFAELFRAHNDGNVICLSGRFVSLETNEAVVRAFLETEHEGGRHALRVEKIMREDDPSFEGVQLG